MRGEGAAMAQMANSPYKCSPPATYSEHSVSNMLQAVSIKRKLDAIAFAVQHHAGTKQPLYLYFLSSGETKA